MCQSFFFLLFVRVIIGVAQAAKLLLFGDDRELRVSGRVEE